MHADLVELGWTEEQWNRIVTTVTEEAQKARVAAQMLPVAGWGDRTAEAIPNFRLQDQANQTLVAPGGVLLAPPRRLAVDSDPTLYFSTIAVNVQLRTREMADPDLGAALVAFRRASNYIARIEDALIFNGRPGVDMDPPFGVAIPQVYRVTGGGAPEGLFPFVNPFGNRIQINVLANAGATLGDQVVTSIVQAVNALDAAGQLGPYACALCPQFFEAICTPNANLVLPRDRILPFIQGPLLRSSAIFEQIVGPVIQAAWGVVVALSGSPVEIVVGSDIHVHYLQTTSEPRFVFRVAERLAVRIKETAALAMLFV